MNMVVCTNVVVSIWINIHIHMFMDTTICRNMVASINIWTEQSSNGLVSIKKRVRGSSFSANQQLSVVLHTVTCIYI